MTSVHTCFGGVNASHRKKALHSSVGKLGEEFKEWSVLHSYLKLGLSREYKYIYRKRSSIRSDFHFFKKKSVLAILLREKINFTLLGAGETLHRCTKDKN